MQDDLLEQAHSRAAAQTKRRKRYIWLAGLCCAVAAATAYALTRPALTMTQQTFCGQQAHTHDESCYETILICGQDEQLPTQQPTPHVHTEACYEAHLVLICGQEESETHTHTEACCETQYTLVCPLEEGEAEDEPDIPAHIHTDACYETRLVCQQPEHTHSLACYADAQADLESASVWEQTIPRTLSGQWRADVVAVAESQLGYAASTRNYIVDASGGMHGYTRYGAWYGSPYGDWCAMFASFCLHYAGVPEESIPAQAGCIRWTEQLQSLGRYAAAGAYAPQPGDLIFFDTGSDGYADHVGLVAEVSEDGASLTTIEGNVGGCVVRKHHTADEAGLLGFGILPEQADNGETPEEPTEPEKPAEPDTPVRTPLCGHEAHTHTADCYDETGALICAHEAHTHTDACYEPAAEKTPLCGHEAHAHTADCYDETGALICTREAHTHTDACYEPAAEKTPLCGMEEHTHTEACYSADGTFICELPEHTHTDACYVAARTQRFSYEDAQLQLALTVESAQPLPEGTELDVQAADAAVFSSLSDEETSDSTEQWIVRSLALVQNGEALDTSAYRMTAEISVTDAVLQPLLDDTPAEAAPEAQTGVTLAVMQADDDGLQELDSATISAAEAAPVFTVSVQSGTIAVLATTANPQFTVQYYAQIPRFDESGNYPLTVFDTTVNGLPQNNVNVVNPKKNIYLKKTSDQTNDTVNAGSRSYYYTVAMTDTLTQVYSSDTFAYASSPGLKYIDKLADNTHYACAALWVLNDGYSPDSPDPSAWTVYENLDDIQFTNRAEVYNASPGSYVYIRPGGQTTLRLVYTAEKDSFTSSAVFYDYDITDGERDGSAWKTGFAGINQQKNYPTNNTLTKWDDKRDTLAFGNGNTGSGMANYEFSGRFLNKYSGVDDDFGCTFGLVDSLDENGHIVYNKWLLVPKLFNDGNANGKKTYSGSSLTFNRVGDTYTLTSATAAGVGSIGGLEKFFNPSPSSGLIYDGENNKDKKLIFTNGFWPLDLAQDKKDPNFGIPEESKRISFTGSGASGTFPDSDDGKAHNSYFGMQYAISFTLTPDYVGPLEYTFFGDDDLWVFLDGKLVCDIGGVHSSVGEYVDLWNYIREIDGTERTESKTHTLTIFYTERGASGSTCYMNFTLPSVSGVTLKQATGNLSVSKEVVGESDPDKAFTFKATFDNTSSQFGYYHFDANGIRDTGGMLASGQTFTLKAGEHIEFQDLPIGMQYTIEELDHSGYDVTNSVNGVISAGASAAGTLIKDMLNDVVFTNTRGSVALKLQKLDQDGTPLSGAVFTLKNAAGEIVWAVKKTEGESTLYTVPSSGANQLLPGAKYSIVPKADANYAIEQDVSAAQYDAKLQPKSDSAMQQFTLSRNTDGSYSFFCDENKKYLDLDAGGLTNGTLVHFWTGTGDGEQYPHENQKWFLIANSDGSFTLKPRVAVLAKSTAVLDLNTGIIAAGQKIQIWEGNNTDAQKWLLVPVEPTAAPETTKDLAVDENGVLQLAGLLPGSYTLTETTAPDGYQALTQPISFRVGADGSVTLADGTITNAAVENGVLQVRNRHDDLTLTLTKALVNSQTTQSFPFTVSYKADGQTFPPQTLSLAGGASGTLQIPYGAEVTITETAHDGFAVTFKSGETLLSSGDSYTFTMTADADITAVNAAGYALPSTGGGAVWVQLAGAALAALASPAFIWKQIKKGKKKGQTRL